MQLDFDLEFKNMKLRQETLKQMTHGNKSTNLFLYFSNLLHLWLLSKNSM